MTITPLNVAVLGTPLYPIPNHAKDNDVLDRVRRQYNIRQEWVNSPITKHHAPKRI